MIINVFVAMWRPPAVHHILEWLLSTCSELRIDLFYSIQWLLSNLIMNLFRLVYRQRYTSDL